MATKRRNNQLFPLLPDLCKPKWDNDVNCLSVIFYHHIGLPNANYIQKIVGKIRIRAVQLQRGWSVCDKNNFSSQCHLLYLSLKKKSQQ